ncbi:Anti-sigma B factor RsbT [Sandaracinus amylolyticus]|nr:Anti-sigma B factor RsbT [Sandaracinus amylolyticus]
MPPVARTNDVEHAVACTLRRYLSEILADSVRRRAQSALGITEGSLVAADLPRLVPRLEQGVRLFVDPALQPALMRELAALEGPRPAPARESHAVTTEEDISRVRLRARELALELGATSLGAQRAATITSELARNIVAYAPPGSVDLEPGRGERTLAIRAVDHGPGIAVLDQVLSGAYRSRTGLGKGLLGVKRLALRFEVKTGPTGTCVETEVAL